MHQHLAWLRADTVLQREKLDEQALRTDMGEGAFFEAHLRHPGKRDSGEVG